MRRMIPLVAAAAVVTWLLLPADAVPAGGGLEPVADHNPFPGCSAPPEPGAEISVVYGSVQCQELTTHLLGDGIAAPFEYYVPPVCAGTRCPVLYLLHGFGGDYTEMLGDPGQTASAWIAAETSAPPAGFEADPWNYYEPAASAPFTWQPASDLPMILVAPLGQTLPGGYGPASGLDSYWSDWNPRYASGGDEQRYTTPPPEFEHYVVDELVPFIEAQLPAGSGRDWRAIAGVSLGGYGAYKLGLQHPDEWTSMESVSGAHNFLFAPAPQPGFVSLPRGVQPPVPVAYTPVPAPAGELGLLPAGSAPSQVGSFTTALSAFGDPVADQAYFRGNMPTDLAQNGRASAGSTPSLGIDGFVNDMVPAPTRLPGDAGSEPFEVIVFPMNVDMEAAFAEQGVANTFAVHQGNHSDVYRNAWLRGLEEFAYSRMLHPAADSGPAGSPPPEPTTFDYRTIATDFEIWGWHVTVTSDQVDPSSGKYTARPSVEFLDLRGVSCHGLTLEGTGRVVLTPPPACGLGSSIAVDLGRSQPADEPAGASATGAYGRTVHLDLGS